MKGRRAFIYEARKGKEVVAKGTAAELAEFLHAGHSTIGNCERTGRKIHNDYMIVRGE